MNLNHYNFYIFFLIVYHVIDIIKKTGVDMTLDLSSLQKAVHALERASGVASSLSEEKDDADTIEVIQAGVIQNFEITYELCWKFMQRWLKENQSKEGVDLPQTRKELFRMAARYGLIRDPLLWFEYEDARNLTSHAYLKEQAKIIFQKACQFLTEAQYLLKQLEQRND